MKTLNKTLSIDSRLLQLYRPLLRRLLIVVVVTAVLAQAALLYFDERLVRKLSSGLIESVASSIDDNLTRRLGVNNNLLVIALEEVGDSTLGPQSSDSDLYSILVPFLDAYPMLDSMNLADTAGNEFVIIRDGDSYLTRGIDATTPDVARWSRLQDDEVIESWERSTDVSPTDRLWFTGAMQHEPRSRHWTNPYELLSTNEPGISVATRWTPESGGRERVIAINLNLIEVSQTTMGLRPSENGLLFVFDDSRRILGLPAHDRFGDERSIASAALMAVDELEIPEINAAVTSWDERGAEPAVFSFPTVDGKVWWAGFSPIRIDAEKAIWSAVLVPRSDLLGSIVMTRNLAILGIILAGVVIAGLMLALAMRSIRRQMKAALDRIEQKLGQYVIEERIGEGGNGMVYRAHHALLRRPTALKLMNPEFASSDAARKRFEHEVRLTSGLSHPNTVAVYDFGRTSDGTLYYAMELLEGSTLNRLVQASGPLPAGRTIHFLLQACGSLAEAHSRGLIHRDIKPSNMIACERGGVYDVLKVVDFGLVQEMAQVDGNLTQADVLIGTPFYMAPEIIREPGAASPSSDLYALGAVGYFLLTGSQVFEGESAVDICAAHLQDEPERPSARLGRGVPTDLEEILLACLAKDPADRPANAAALRDALAECADAGSWGPAEAAAWWSEYGAGVSGAAVEDETPMSRTELLVDLDSRLISADRASDR